MLKRALAATPALLVLAYGLWIGPKYDRYVLPAFDGYVYDAMADTPDVFTLAPWGYRILAPRIVHLLPTASAAQGFYWLNLLCLTLTLVVLDRWLLRLGFGAGPRLLAGIVFVLSPPLRGLLEYQVLVDPLALLIVALILLELTSPRLIVLTALFAAGALCKEVCLLPLVMVLPVLVQRRGAWSGILATAGVGLPALGLAAYLRLTWGEPRATLGLPLLELAMERLQQSKDVLDTTLSLWGVGILAVVGLLREPSVMLRLQGAALWLLTFAATFLNPYHFSTPDLPRLSVFVWPALLPLALTGLGFRRDPGSEAAPTAGPGVKLAALGTLLACVFLVVRTDSFRHEPEDAWADPIPYLARNREAIKTALLLDEGGALSFDAMSGRYAGPIGERFNLTEGRRHRWFLFAGFGPDAVYESGAPMFRGEARLLLPVMTPRPMTMSIEFEGPKDVEVKVSISGRELAVLRTGAPGGTFMIPGAWLSRGDNILDLRGPLDQALHLNRFEVRAVIPGSASSP